MVQIFLLMIIIGTINNVSKKHSINIIVIFSTNENKIKNHSKEDVSIISDIHIKAFQSSLLTKLGFRVVSKYYLWQLLNENEVYPMLVENENNEILGYCFGGVFKAALVGFIMHNKFIILKSILLKPSIVFNWHNIIKIKDAIFTILLKKLTIEA